MLKPRVVDNDKDEITVWLNGVPRRGWSYFNDDEQRIKMVQAREYVAGWYDGWEDAKQNYLEGFDA